MRIPEILANAINAMTTTSYRFSGHETFPCRYAWLPKAANAVSRDPHLFASDREDDAIATLGVGKNMVRAIRFWAEVTGITVARQEGGYNVTDFGARLLVGTPHDVACDPFLEDIQTLWLLHWNISTQKEAPVFAWDFLLNRWQSPELTKTAVSRAFRSEANIQKRELSGVTLDQHWEVFLHTYVPTRGRKGEVIEDTLDSPFTELELLRREGFRETAEQSGKAEPIYAFNRDEKPDIGDALFSWCLDDFWRSRLANDLTMPFGMVASGQGGPGQIFKLPEDDIRLRLERIEKATNGRIVFNDSALTPQLERRTMERLFWEDIYATAFV